MSGYKRVNYYELCRLCATNQQKEKTHIFKEEGRKIQLLNKIQTCLSLTVYENDYLPKVVCSKCLKCLESFYTFKQECVSSETMLSSYFKNFRYTEDFKKSGKVYIKDTTVKLQNDEETHGDGNVTTTVQAPVVHPQNSAQNVPLVQNYMALNEAPQVKSLQPPSVEQQQLQQVQSYYTVQLPQQPQPIETKNKSTELTASSSGSKIIQNSQVTTYNLNTVSSNVIKTQQKTQQQHQETINNVVVNANGEVINIGQIIDLESFMNQTAASNLQKPTHKSPSNKHKRAKDRDEQTENEKHPHIKNNKFPTTYTAPPQKLDDKLQLHVNPTVLYNTVQEYHQVPISNFVPFHQNHILNSTTVNLTQNAPPICTKHETSTVNLNALNSTGDLPSKNENNGAGVVAKPEKLHVCDVCHKSFKRREHLYQHIKLHTGFRPYTCENCNKSFMRKEHLLRHMTSHSGQKNYTCNICDKSFSRNDNLLKHRKTHDKQNSFTCEVCQKQFVMKHYYLAHKMTHEVVERCIGQTLGILKA